MIFSKFGFYQQWHILKGLVVFFVRRTGVRMPQQRTLTYFVSTSITVLQLFSSIAGLDSTHTRKYAVTIWNVMKLLYPNQLNLGLAVQWHLSLQWMVIWWMLPVCKLSVITMGFEPRTTFAHPCHATGSKPTPTTDECKAPKSTKAQNFSFFFRGQSRGLPRGKVLERFAARKGFRRACHPLQLQENSHDQG